MITQRALGSMLVVIVVALLFYAIAIGIPALGIEREPNEEAPRQPATAMPPG